MYAYTHIYLSIYPKLTEESINGGKSINVGEIICDKFDNLERFSIFDHYQKIFFLNYLHFNPERHTNATGLVSSMNKV